MYLKLLSGKAYDLGDREICVAFWVDITVLAPL